MKIQNSVFSIGRNFCSINRNGKEIYPRVFTYFDWFSIPVWSVEKSIRSIRRNSQQIKTHKLNFLQKFLVSVLKVWRCFKPCERFYEMTLYMCLLMKYGNNLKSYGYSQELLFVELNNLVVFWGQVCDNPLTTRVWG